jgi:hypothetical protein
MVDDSDARDPREWIGAGVVHLKPLEQRRGRP